MIKTKNNNAYTVIKNLILKEKIDTGKMLSVSHISETIGMGRAPVMDAVKRLEAEDMLKIIPRQGIMIREMTVKEMRDINETRIVLESYIMERIASKFQDSDSKALWKLIEMMRHYDAIEDYYNFIVSDHDMHMYLYELCDNARMIDILKNLRDRIFTVGFKIIARREGRMKSTIEEHEAILRALEEGDPTKAAEKMRVHLTNGWHLI